MGSPLFNTVQLTLRPIVAVNLSLTKRSVSSYTYCVNKTLSHCWNCTRSNFQKTKVCQPHAVLSLTTRKMSNTQDLCGVHKDFIFRQLLDYKSYTYTYILADPDSKEAVIIDPVVDLVDRDLKIVKDLNLNLKYAVNTHVHADHITGTGEIKKKLPSCKSIISEVSKASADVKIQDGSQIDFGKFKLEVRSTPGHTNGCCTYVWHEKNMAFTGDALLIRGCGRTDFQEGSPSILYESVHSKILSLPESFALYPAHDYTGQTSTTVGEEKRLNPRLSKPKSAFIEIMKNLNLPYPKQIDKALPANMVCGVYETEEQQAKA